MLKGKVHKYGANVDTDMIIPARSAGLLSTTRQRLASRRSQSAI